GLDVGREEDRRAQSQARLGLDACHDPDPSYGDSRTGSVLSWLMNGDSTVVGLPASSIEGKRRSVSSNMSLSSRRASAVPRQKWRPPAPKAWCSGLRLTSKRFGSS